MKHNTHGFTMMELLIGILISSILVLMVGAISSISLRSYERMRQEAEVFNDAFHALSLIKHAVRNSLVVSADQANNTLTADNLIFQVNSQDANNLIYTDTTDNSNHTIVEGAGNLNFALTSPDARFININLSGEKLVPGYAEGNDKKVEFNLSTMVMRRN